MPDLGHLIGHTVLYETSCHFSWVWNHLSRAIRHTEASCYMFGVCGSLRDFGKGCNWSGGRLLLLSSLRLGRWMQGGLGRKKLHKGTMVVSLLPSLERVVVLTPDPRLLLKLVSQFHPVCALALFDLLSLLCSLEQVSLCKSPSRAMSQSLVVLCLSQTQFHCFSQPEVIGTPLPHTSAPGWEAWCETGHLVLRETSAAEISLLFLKNHTMGWGNLPLLPLMKCLLYSCRIYPSVLPLFRWFLMAVV